MNAPTVPTIPDPTIPDPTIPDPVGPTPTVDPVALEDRFAAHTYHPLPVTLVHGEGSWVTDDRGRRYLDLLSAYSALNFGHRHPRLVAAAKDQLERLTLTSRAFHNDQLGPFCAELAELVGLDAVIQMNTGAEAVESAIKAARRWAHDVKGVPDGQATIITAENCFHGRTTTIIGFSTDPQARRGFGPFTPGFRPVPFGDAAAIEAAIDGTTAAVLIEPVQGEAGVIVPPPGYLRAVRAICDRHHVLFIADEIQSGLGRTGRTLACDHEEVRPDVVLLGKALGGGILPISAMVARREVVDTFEPGSHGSTFGGNPLACAIAREVIALLGTGEPQRAAADLGTHLTRRLDDLPHDLPDDLPDDLHDDLPDDLHDDLHDEGPRDAPAPVGARGAVTAVRTIGLWAGIDIAERIGTARSVSEQLMHRGVLVKDTHLRTLRLAPPLTISPADLDLALDRLTETLNTGDPHPMD